MKRFAILACAAALAATTAVSAAEPAATCRVTVDPAKETGRIKLMNSVNNGPAVSPVLGDQKRGNFEYYKAARFPMARLHDSINCCSGGAHAVDVNAVFPNFDADENDPKNYDFVFTDHYLDTIVRTGTKVYYRLGQTIEHGPKKYGALPPKDFKKWARICEHIVRHYNEGWGWATDKARTTHNVAWSNQFNIVYWEIWNEPDLDVYEDAARNVAPRCWGGSVTNFFQLYETAAKHLKAKFPKLKIGGPAICGNQEWGERFLSYCRDNKCPLDFFSWHGYATTTAWPVRCCQFWRKALDDRGFEKTESIYNEWNYVKGWCDDWVYSLEVESGRYNQKAAAFIAAMMTDCQQVPLDHLMFYDARATCGMNAIFDRLTLWPLKGYYPYLCWNKLLDAGTQVAATLKEGRGKKCDATTGIVFDAKKAAAPKGQFHAVAAKGAKGETVVFVTRYCDDNNETDMGEMTLRVVGRDASKARVHVTDAIRTHTETPPIVLGDGTIKVFMMANSFAVIEL